MLQRTRIGAAGRILREPMLHFLLIGLLVFGAYSVVDEPPARSQDQVIVVSPDQVARLEAQFQAVWRRPPSAEERTRLIEDFVEEEVLYREALALGLDRGDTVIRRRLRQKMEFLTDAAADGIAADEADLRAHFDAYVDRFREPPRVAFEQVFLGESPQQSEIERALVALNGGADAGRVGRTSLLPAEIPLAPPTAVDGTFGAGFFDAVTDLGAGGSWQGPIASAYGQHLVRVSEITMPGPPDFEAVRDVVEADWRRERASELRADRLDTLRARYEIVLPDASEAPAG